MCTQEAAGGDTPNMLPDGKHCAQPALYGDCKAQGLWCHGKGDRLDCTGSEEGTRLKVSERSRGIS